MSWEKRKQYRIDARKYHDLKTQINGLAFRVEQLFCRCDVAFIKLGRIDPACQSHEIAEYISSYLQSVHLTPSTPDPAATAALPVSDPSTPATNGSEPGR